MTEPKARYDWSKSGPVPELSQIDTVKSPTDYTMGAKDFTVIDLKLGSSSTALVLGASYTGKSTFMVQSLKNILKVPGAVDVVVIFTESINAAPLRALPGSDKITIAQGFYPNIVRLMYRINRATGNRYKFMNILDDICDLRANKTFLKMILTYRNSMLSTIVLTQYAKLIGPAHRSSFHNIYFTGSGPSVEMKEFIVKNWLGGYIKGRLGIPSGCTKRGVVTLLNSWFEENTGLGVSTCEVGTEDRPAKLKCRYNCPSNRKCRERKGAHSDCEKCNPSNRSTRPAGSGKFLKLDTIKGDLSVQFRPPKV